MIVKEIQFDLGTDDVPGLMHPLHITMQTDRDNGIDFWHGGNEAARFDMVEPASFLDRFKGMLEKRMRKLAAEQARMFVREFALSNDPMTRDAREIAGIWKGMIG